MTQELILRTVSVSAAGCWEWLGYRDQKGYGKVNRDGKMQGVHRISWHLFRGEIPAGMFICHHCDNPPCVNPDHLFVGTNQDNLNDMMAKGGKWRDTCSHGHTMRLGTFYVRPGPNTQRVCLVCRRLNAKLYRARHLEMERAKGRERECRRRARLKLLKQAGQTSPQ